MKKEEENKIFQRVTSLKGVKYQNIKLKEELSELLTENIRLETGRNKPNSKELIGEQTDSIVMMKQWFWNHNKPQFEELILPTIKSIKELNIVITKVILSEHPYFTNYNLRYIYDYILRYAKENNTLGLLSIQIDSKLKKLEERTLTGDL